MKKFYTILFLEILFINVNAQIIYIGLGNTKVNDLSIMNFGNDTIYASTNDGIYKISNFYPQSGVWLPVNFQGKRVIQTVSDGDSILISMVEIDSMGRYQIHKSTDWGNTFNLMLPDTTDSIPYPFLDCMTYGATFNEFYSPFHHKKTLNGGQTWDTLILPPMKVNFITRDSYLGNPIIIGGESLSGQPLIVYSSDSGNIWNIPAMTGMPGPNSVYSLNAKYSSNADWCAGTNGIIYQSGNLGNTWSPLTTVPSVADTVWCLDNFVFLSCMGTGSHSNQIYANFSYDRQNWGWDITSTFDSLPSEIHSMTSANSSFGENLYMGGHGVYFIDLMVGGIDEIENSNLSVYPNPLDGSILTISLNEIRNYQADVFNNTGQLILSFEINELNRQIDLGDINNGIYSLRFTDKIRNTVERVKFIKIN